MPCVWRFHAEQSIRFHSGVGKIAIFLETVASKLLFVTRNALKTLKHCRKRVHRNFRVFRADVSVFRVENRGFITQKHTSRCYTLQFFCVSSTECKNAGVRMVLPHCFVGDGVTGKRGCSVRQFSDDRFIFRTVCNQKEPSCCFAEGFDPNFEVVCR